MYVCAAACTPLFLASLDYFFVLFSFGFVLFFSFRCSSLVANAVDLKSCAMCNTVPRRAIGTRITPHRHTIKLTKQYCIRHFYCDAMPSLTIDAHSLLEIYLPVECGAISFHITLEMRIKKWPTLSVHFVRHCSRAYSFINNPILLSFFMSTTALEKFI